MNTKKTIKFPKEIVQSIKTLYETKQKITQAMAEAKKIEKKETLNISNWMFSNLPEGQESFVVDLGQYDNYNFGENKLRVTKTRTKKIIWDVSKLKEKLSKDLFKRVTDKTYYIVDMEGLVRYLKKCGVNPKKFKMYVSSDIEVNEQKLDEAFQNEEIDMKQLEGCYSLKLGEPYMRMTKWDEV